MVSNNFSKEFEPKEFEYGNHTIVVFISIEHTHLSNPKYGRGGTGYFRKVIVRSYKTEQYEDDEASVSTDAYNATVCRIREEEYEPLVDRPDDPDLNAIQLLKVLLSSDITKEDIKEQLRQQNEKEYAEQYIPKGPRVPLEKQIEESVIPVLEMVDEQYGVVHNDSIEMDIEVSLERFEAEVSWIDIKDETERISKEIENLTSN